MSADHYTKTLHVNANPEKAFSAITEEIDKWWTITSNKARNINDPLRVEFGDNTYKVMRIRESLPGKSLKWEVIEAHIGHETFSKKDEWVGTQLFNEENDMLIARP